MKVVSESGEATSIKEILKEKEAERAKKKFTSLSEGYASARDSGGNNNTSARRFGQERRKKNRR